MKEFPKYVYHEKSGTAGKVVASQEEHDALGGGWHESPAKFGMVTAPSLDQLDENGKAIKLAQAEVKMEERDLTRVSPIAPDAVLNKANEKMGADPKRGADAKEGVK